ncbi:MAG: phosphoglycerate mutase family protein [Candidatus Shapirobacteria bacterium]
MKLILVRHGESQANAGNIAEENNLTEKGRQQAKKLAIELSQENFEQIYCSNTKRCIETMEAILKDRKEYVNICFSKLISPKKKAEDDENFKRRIKIFIEDLKIEFKDETVMIISHQLVIRRFWQELTGKDEPIENGEAREIDL